MKIVFEFEVERIGASSEEPDMDTVTRALVEKVNVASIFVQGAGGGDHGYRVRIAKYTQETPWVEFAEGEG